MDIRKTDIIANKKYVYPRIKASIKYIMMALKHMEDVVNRLSYLVDNEKSLTDMEREILYSYGIEKAKIDIVRLSNSKKSLNCILPVGK